MSIERGTSLSSHRPEVSQCHESIGSSAGAIALPVMEQSIPARPGVPPGSGSAALRSRPCSRPKRTGSASPSSRSGSGSSRQSARSSQPSTRHVPSCPRHRPAHPGRAPGGDLSSSSTEHPRAAGIRPRPFSFASNRLNPAEWECKVGVKH